MARQRGRIERGAGWAVRGLLWDLPVGAGRRTWNGYRATLEYTAQRWLAWAGWGLWLWGLHWLAQWTTLEGFIRFTSVLLLVWIWRALVLVRWTLRIRMDRARARAEARADHQVIQQLPKQLREQTEGVVTMLRTRTVEDPTNGQLDELRKEQADRVRVMLGPDQAGYVSGQEFEPIFRWPKRWRRKRQDDR